MDETLPASPKQPGWGFAFLVGELHEKEVFPFDAPVLNMLHAMATPTLDGFFALMTQLDHLWGVVPLDLIVLLSLALRRRFRDALSVRYSRRMERGDRTGVGNVRIGGPMRSATPDAVARARWPRRAADQRICWQAARIQREIRSRRKL